MEQIRVKELAQELHIPSKRLIDTLKSVNMPVESEDSVLDGQVVGVIRKVFARAAAPQGQGTQAAEKKPLVAAADAKPQDLKPAAQPPKPVEKAAAPTPAPEKSPEASRPVPREAVGEKTPGTAKPAAEPGGEERRSATPVTGNVERAAREAQPVKQQTRPQPPRPAAPPPPKQKPKNTPVINVKLHEEDLPETEHDETAHTPARGARPGEKDSGWANHRGSGGNRQRPGQQGRSQQKRGGPRPAEKPAGPKVITLTGPITVSELAGKLARPGAEIIKKLMQLSVFATMNQAVTADTAALVAGEYGFEVKMHTVEQKSPLEIEPDRPEELVARPPVVTVMGHVDHGKTSLLDGIRQAHVAAQEAGGITQAIGAYQVSIKGKLITFLDTPGHEAFTAMRARGAKVTDIVILVVAADDGVMPQTVEALNHARAANVPIIVAVNKMDKAGANPDRVMSQLSELGVMPEEWGGDTIFVRVSAVKKTGIDDLLESIITLSEVLEVKANPNRPARGTVVEAKIDKGKGPVATVLVSRGTLRVGDAVYIGETCGKIRAMMDAAGKRITEATPSTPVEIQGLEGVPEASDLFYVVSDERVARDLATEAQQKKRESNVQVKQAVSLEGLFDAIKAGERKELPIVVKADVQGSLEALTPAIERLSLDEVQVKVIHGSVGPVTESDVMLAQASGAIIIGFNVRPEPSARRMAEQSNVDIRLYRIIYDCLNDIEAALKGMLAPVFREVVLGSAEVRQVFKITKVGTIAGCYVTEGKISRSAKVRIVRNGVEVFTGNIDSLKRFKDDAKEVAAGYECGIGIENYNDLKEGDRIEAYTQEQVQPA